MSNSGSDGSGSCLSIVGFVALLAGIYVWVGNVHTIYVTEKVPAPVDSWNIVLPQFEDSVSDQLLNTQKITGSVLNATSEIKAQNTDLQNSVNLLLGNLGIMKEESYLENKRQRVENITLTVASVIAGWGFGLLTPEVIKKLGRKNKGAENADSNPPSSSSKGPVKTANAVNPAQRRPVTRPQPTRPQPTRPPVASQSILRSLPPQSVRLCPKCNIKMEIRADNQGKQYWVCPNFKQCKQALPVEGT